MSLSQQSQPIQSPPLLQSSAEEIAEIRQQLDESIKKQWYSLSDPEKEQEGLNIARLTDYITGWIDDMANAENPDVILMSEVHPMGGQNLAATRLTLHRGQTLGIETASNILAQNFDVYLYNTHLIALPFSQLTPIQNYLEEQIQLTQFLLGANTADYAIQTHKLQKFLLANKIEPIDAAKTGTLTFNTQDPDTQDALNQTIASLPWYKRWFTNSKNIKSISNIGIDVRNHMMTKSSVPIKSCGQAHVAGWSYFKLPYKGSMLDYGDKANQKILAPFFTNKTFPAEDIPRQGHTHPALRTTHFDDREWERTNQSCEIERNAITLEGWGVDHRLHRQFLSAVEEATLTVTEIFEQTAALCRQGKFSTVVYSLPQGMR